MVISFLGVEKSLQAQQTEQNIDCDEPYLFIISKLRLSQDSKGKIATFHTHLIMSMIVQVFTLLSSVLCKVLYFLLYQFILIYYWLRKSLGQPSEQFYAYLSSASLT